MERGFSCCFVRKSIGSFHYILFHPLVITQSLILDTTSSKSLWRTCESVVCGSVPSWSSFSGDSSSDDLSSDDS